MKLAKLVDQISVADQIFVNDLNTIADQGFKSILCHRPDGEGSDQPNFEEIANAAKKHKVQIQYLPVVSGKISDEDVDKFTKAFSEAPKPVLAYCRSGMRAASLWALAEASKLGLASVLEAGKKAGYDLSGLTMRLAGNKSQASPKVSHEVVIVGGGAAGVAVASSLLSRNSSLDVVIVDPADTHYYQPGWTMVGGGVFNPSTTATTMASVIPSKAKWVKAAVAGFDPENNQIILEGCRVIHYDVLIVCPGVKLNWNAIGNTNGFAILHGRLPLFC